MSAFVRFVSPATRLLTVGLLLAISSAVWAQRPSGAHLLPEETVGFVQITSVPDLVESFQQTSLGRIGNDPQVRPLVTDLFERATDLLAQVEQAVGVPVETLLRIPQGEVTLAAVAVDDQTIALVGLLDVGDQALAARQVVERLTDRMVAGGFRVSLETVEGTELTVLTAPGDRQQHVVIGQHQATYVISNQLDAVRQLLAQWTSGEASSLAADPAFATVMTRSTGLAGETPQISWYANPIQWLQVGTRGNFAMQAGLALFPALGLDGIRAVGGGVLLNTEDFDTVFQAHLLLDPPRTGVVEMLALVNGDSTPERWVPADVVSYMTLHYEFAQSYEALRTIFNGLRGEGALEEAIDRGISDALGVDFRHDVLDALDGRITHATWVERPVRLNSQCQLVAARLKDPDRFRSTLESAIQQFPLTQETYGGNTYWLSPVGAAPANDAPVRQPIVCVGIVGDYLVVADSRQLMERVIATDQGSLARLADDLEFKLVSSQFERLGGRRLAMTQFNRPEESIRMLYSLATDGDLRAQLQAGGGNNPLLRAVNESLESNPLPPFAVIAQYLAPGGAIVTSDGAGLHYISFTLKRQ